MRPNLPLDRSLRDKEARTDQRFITGPVFASSIAEFAYSSKECLARKFDAIFIFNTEPFAELLRVLTDRSRLRRRQARNVFRQ